MSVKMKDPYGNEIVAVVGDTVVTFCPITKRLVVDRIVSLKKRFVVGNLKLTPKASECIWLSR